MPSPLGVSRDLMRAVEACMHSIVATAQPLCANIAGEHLTTGGKRLRAALALAATRALGGTEERAIPWAAACELMHNATLIHDDLQDGDILRRGQPTVWARHGAAAAINVGDLMLFQALLVLRTLEVSATQHRQLVGILAEKMARVVEGQIAESALPEHEMTWDKYLEAVEGKTAALFELPVEGAALIAGQEVADAARLADAARPLGTLFQLQDDILDLFGNKGRQMIGTDLQEGKISSLVVAHLRLHPQHIESLMYQLKQPREQTPQSWVHETIARFQNDGALAWVADRIQQLRQEIDQSEIWARYPKMGEVVRALVRTILEPVAHVVAVE